MSVYKLHLIPDALKINESLKLCEKYDAAFEYNDFFDPKLLDDEFELNRVTDMYKSLDRDRSKDTLHGVFYDICLNSSDSLIRDISVRRAVSSLEIAQKLDCKGVIFHTNIIPGFEAPFYLNGWLDMHEEFYMKMCEKYPDLEIYVENMFDLYPDMLLKLAERLKNVHNFGVCYDVAHGEIHDVPIREWIEKLAPYIKHLHINDTDGHSDTHDAVGDGIICWDEYFGLLKEKDINASMLVEVRQLERQVKSLDFLKGKGFI